MTRVVTAVHAPTDGLLPPALPRAEYADAFSTALLTGDPETADGWALLSLDAVPRWIAVAMVLRNVLARSLGLKAAPRGTERTLPFPELARTANEILFGVDDRHLDFRAVLRVEQGHATFATSVQVNNAVGRAYWTVVRRIHPVVVTSLLRSAPLPDRPHRETQAGRG
jgi:Protein of unknown function (DUF2867)